MNRQQTNRHLDLAARDAATVLGWRYEPRIVLERVSRGPGRRCAGKRESGTFTGTWSHGVRGVEFRFPRLDSRVPNARSLPGRAGRESGSAIELGVTLRREYARARSPTVSHEHENEHALASRPAE